MEVTTVIVTVYNDYSVVDDSAQMIHDLDDTSQLNLGTFTERSKAMRRYERFLEEENVIIDPDFDDYDGTSNHPVKGVTYITSELDSLLVLDDVPPMISNVDPSDD